MSTLVCVGSLVFHVVEIASRASQRQIVRCDSTERSDVRLRSEYSWTKLRQRSDRSRRDRNQGRVPDNDDNTSAIVVILPESPMNFMYNDDREFQQFIEDFARRNNVSVLFNSAEPDATNGKYFNSAVMVGPDGKEVGTVRQDLPAAVWRSRAVAA